MKKWEKSARKTTPEDVSDFFALLLAAGAFDNAPFNRILYIYASGDFFRRDRMIYGGSRPGVDVASR